MTEASPRAVEAGNDGNNGRALIFTADDFGLHTRVNAAVERAHRDGVLNAASLMVAAPAAADAVARARQLPNLRVGLHLVLADGAAMLPRAQIPALVDANGRFGDNMALDGVRFFFLPHVRAQLAKEIRAQFEAFAATGLALDHVNTHKHFHLHPTILSLILSIGRDYGLRAMRLPLEAGAPLALKPWLALVRTRLARAGVAHNDYVVGIAKTGAMDEAVLLDALAHLPPQGVGEIYCHPAEAPEAGEGPITPSMSTYRHADELGALISPRVAEALERSGVRHGGFTDVFFGEAAKLSAAGGAGALAREAQASS
jgi:chitin disaccharide deacetylase